MQLVKPSQKYKKSFLEALKEFHQENNLLECDFDTVKNDFSLFIKYLEEQETGINLPENLVPATTFWLIDNGEFIGRLSIRHFLNKNLLKEGGHIGYNIRPSKRRRGYGKKILELGLLKAKEIGIKRALVTCDETNTPSKKIIEANGGVYENSELIAEGRPLKLRYWIEIK